MFMYRKIFKAESKEDLRVELPEEYLNKHVEVLAFQVDDEDYLVKKQNLKEAFAFFNSMQVDMSNFKFDRDEANAR